MHKYSHLYKGKAEKNVSLKFINGTAIKSLVTVKESKLSKKKVAYDDNILLFGLAGKVK